MDDLCPGCGRAQRLRDERRARHEVAVSADRRPLTERELHNVAELLAPRDAEVPVPAHEVVDVHERRLRHPVVAPGRLRLLQVDEVGRLRGLTNAGHELRSRHLAARAPEPLQPSANPAGRRLDGNDLHRQVGGGLSRFGEVLARCQPAHLDAVRRQSAQKPDRSPAGGAAFGQRRLCEHDENLDRPILAHYLSSVQSGQRRVAARRPRRLQ